MRKIILFALVSLSVISCRNDKKKNEQADTYKKSKLTIEEIEKQNPVKFLTVTGKDKHNLIGQTVVKGEITNKATVVSYKDITIAISFISKTGTELESDEEVVYDEVKPGDNIDFKSKFFAPKGTADVKMKIVKATPVN